MLWCAVLWCGVVCSCLVDDLTTRLRVKAGAFLVMGISSNGKYGREDPTTTTTNFKVHEQMNADVSQIKKKKKMNKERGKKVEPAFFGCWLTWTEERNERISVIN